MRDLVYTAICLAALATPASAHASEIPVPVDGTSRSAPVSSTVLDYGVLDAALKDMVFDLGPSERAWAPRKSNANAIGSRLYRGNTSPYRLEGTRFLFGYVTDAYLSALSAYRRDLQDIAARLDISTLPRDEQLAFWFNLHNVARIELIAKAYPVTKPENITVDVDGRSYSIDTAPVIKIGDRTLSLEGIRTRIVYPGWDDPDVIYGFYRGEIGGPMLMRTAFTGENVHRQLDEIAGDFVNSLRGFHRRGKTSRISKIYHEVAPHYFPDFQIDIRAHLLSHAKADAASEIRAAKRLNVAPYETRIADLSNGKGRNGGFSVASTNTRLDGRPVRRAGMSVDATQIVTELATKAQRMERRGLLPSQGTVTIEDLPDLPED